MIRFADLARLTAEAERGVGIDLLGKAPRRRGGFIPPPRQFHVGQDRVRQLCTVEPVGPSSLHIGDIVLCKVNGREYLHLIKAIQGQRFQIGNNRGRINGWVSAGAIFGRCVSVES